MPPSGFSRSTEKPLSGLSKLALTWSAGGMILLFYLFAFACVVALVALLLCELLAVLVLARFGLAAPMARAMGRHLAPLPVFLRSFWVRQRTEFRLVLQPADAPRLFAL